MILGRLAQADLYARLHPGLDRAFDFLRQPNLEALAPGRHDIDGDRVYAMVQRVPGRGRDKAVLETHRKYIDVQFVVTNSECMGWKLASYCRSPQADYDAEKDFQLFSDSPDTWFDVPPGAYVVFFPDDAHAPLAGEAEVLKVVVKVAIEP